MIAIEMNFDLGATLGVALVEDLLGHVDSVSECVGVDHVTSLPHSNRFCQHHHRRNLLCMPNDTDAIWVYVSWDGDHIGRTVGKARLDDDEVAVKRLSQAIDSGNELWKSWALAHGGDVISCGGDEGSVRIGADHLQDLPELRERYMGMTKATVSVGIGTKLSEADKSLLAAKLMGGDKIQIYSDEVEEMIKDAPKKTEAQKISEEYLNKAGQKEPALNTPSAGGGITGPSTSPAAAPAAPSGEASEHSENEALGSMIDNAPDAASAPQPDMDQLQDFLSSSADEQGQKDSADQQNAQGAADEEQGKSALKEQILKILKVWKTRGKELEQMSEEDPELYKAMVGMLQTMVSMAKQLFGDEGVDEQPQQDQSKSSDSVTKSELQKGWPTPQEDEGAKVAHDYFQGGGDATTQSKAVHINTTRAHLINKEAAVRNAPAYTNPRPAPRSPLLGTVINSSGYERTGVALDNNYMQRIGHYNHSNQPAFSPSSKNGFVPSQKYKTFNAQAEARQNDHEFWQDAETGSKNAARRLDAGEQPSHLQTSYGTVTRQNETPDAYHKGTVSQMRERARKAGFPNIAKAALEAGKTGRHNVILPVGSQKDASANGSRDSGQLKVADPNTGQTKWRSVRAGLVMAPDGSPVSSRNPSGGK